MDVIRGSRKDLLNRKTNIQYQISILILFSTIFSGIQT